MATRQVEGGELTDEEYHALKDSILFKYKKEIRKKQDAGILEYVQQVCA